MSAHQDEGLDFIPLPLSTFSGKTPQEGLPDAWETLQERASLPASTIPPFKPYGEGSHGEASSGAWKPSSTPSTFGRSGSTSSAFSLEEEEEGALPSLPHEEKGLPSLPVEAPPAAPVGRAGKGIPLPPPTAMPSKAAPKSGSSSSALPPLEEGPSGGALPALDEGSVVGRALPLDKEAYQQQVLASSAPPKKKGYAGLVISLVLLLLVSGLGFFGYQFYQKNTEEGKKAKDAQALYDANGKGVIDQVACPNWQTLDDGVTKHYSCEGAKIQALVSRGKLDDKTVWTRTAQEMKADAFVVKDGYSWGVLSTKKDDLLQLSQATGRPICDLKGGVNLYCPVG